MEGGFYPVGVAGVGNEVDFKFQFGVEGFVGGAGRGGEGRGVGFARAVNEVAGVRGFEAVLAEEPLVDFHLALVAVLPVFVERGDGFRFGGGFVVYDDIFVCCRIEPQVVDCATDREAGGRVQVFHAVEVVAPGVEGGMGDGEGF